MVYFQETRKISPSFEKLSDYVPKSGTECIPIQFSKRTGNNGCSSQISSDISGRMRRIHNRPNRSQDGNQSQRHPKRLKKNGGHDNSSSLNSSAANRQDQSHKDKLNQGRCSHRIPIEVRRKDSDHAQHNCHSIHIAGIA